MALSVLSQRGPTHALAYRRVSAPLAARMLQAQTQQFAYPACTRHRKVRPTLPPLQWSQSQQEQQATQAMKELSVSNVRARCREAHGFVDVLLVYQLALTFQSTAGSGFMSLKKTP